MDSFDVVVIGSGALGASTAFHLARAGRSVAVLDKAAIASQTSPRAAGLTGQVRQTEALTRLAVRAVEKIGRFTEETGEPMVFHQPGSLTIARTPEHLEGLHARVARGKRFGCDIDMIAPEEARALMPFLHTKGVLGVCHMRTDLYLEPGQLPTGYARAAERLGAKLMPDTEVTGIVVENGAAARVATTRGEFGCGAVVDAAGGWLRAVAALGGAAVPVVPVRHQLMVTVPLPGVADMLPVSRVVDTNVYIRPCKGGLMLGGYEPDPMAFDLRGKPGFRVEDVPLDLAVLRRLAETVHDQFPVFRDVAIQELRGGVPTMTMDADYMLGPAPGLPGLFVIGGCNVGGLSVSPALGELLAGWIVNGRPATDVPNMDPGRFGAVAEAELLERCRTRYATYYSYRFQ
jgi:glycine/D-amino acid oxidase-like deaminating enzyme